MSNDAQITTVKPRASQALSILTGIDPAMMLDTIKAQCFKGDPSRVSDTQLAAFVSIAAEMGVNPLLPGMMYAFPIQGGGIVPMMGPDAVFKKLAEHPNVDSWKTTVYPEDVTLAPTHATTEIFLRNSQRPLTYTALLSEWKIGANPNWNARPRHMLSLRSLKQAARQVIHGVPFDEDERQIADMQNVTNTAAQEPAPERPEPPARKKRGAAAVQEAEVVSEPAKVEEAKVAPEPVKEAVKTVEPAKVVEAAEPAKTVTPTATPQPRAFLQDGENITAIVEVVSAEGVNISQNGKPTPSVKATVKGEYNNVVRMVAAGVAGEGGAVTPAKPWEVGARLKLKLQGKLSAAKEGQPNFGAVLAWVSQCEVLAPVAAEEGEG